MDILEITNRYNSDFSSDGSEWCEKISLNYCYLKIYVYKLTDNNYFLLQIASIATKFGNCVIVADLN